MSKLVLEKGNTLPEKWIETSLDQISDVILGQSPPSSTYNKEKDGLPFFQGKTEFGKLYPTPKIWCNKPKKFAEKNDVLLSVRAPVGTTNLCPEKSCIGRGLAAIRPKGDIPVRFILYFLRHIEHDLERQGTGTTFKAISGNQIKSITIPLPPLNEQKRIVAKIEELFSKLDAIIELLNKVKLQLKQYRQSLLKAAIEGTLFGGKARYSQEPISEVIDSLGQGWSPRCERNPSLNERDWVVMKTTAIQPLKFDGNQNKKLPHTLKPKSDLELKEGDILITRAGPRSRVGITCLVRKPRPRLLLCDKAYRIRCKKDLIDSAYLEIVLNAPNIVKEIDTLKTGISDSGVNITQDRFLNLLIPLPSLDEQKKIVKTLEDTFSQIDKCKEIIEQSLRQSYTERKDILNVAFTGDLVSQDQNNEPASTLLERIKQEKEKKLQETKKVVKIKSSKSRRIKNAK